MNGAIDKVYNKLKKIYASDINKAIELLDSIIQFSKDEDINLFPQVAEVNKVYEEVKRLLERDPQLKAIQLLRSVAKISRSSTTFKEHEQGAHLIVDEVIAQWEYIDTYLADLGGKLNPNLKYWYDVKKELTNLKIITI